MNKILTLISDTAKSYNTRKNIFRLCVALVLSCILSVFLKIRFPYCIRWTVPSFLFCNVVCISLILRYFDALFCKSRKQLIAVVVCSLLSLPCFFFQLKELSHPDIRDNQFSVRLTSGELYVDGPTPIGKKQFSYVIYFMDPFVTKSEGWRKNQQTFTRKEDGKFLPLEFSLPTKMIHDLSLQITFRGTPRGDAASVLTVNGKEIPFEVKKSARVDIPIPEDVLLLPAEHVSPLYLFIGVFGYCLLLFCLFSWLEMVVSQIYCKGIIQHELIIKGLVVIGILVGSCANYWARIPSEFYAMQQGKATQWYTQISGLWWNIADFLLPTKQSTGAFVVAFYSCFLIGFRMLLGLFLKRKYVLCAYFMFYAVWGIVYTKTFATSAILVDQIIASMAMLSVGLLVRLYESNRQSAKYICGIVFLICLVFMVTVRWESVLLALPMGILFMAYWFRSEMPRKKYLALSVGCGLLLCFAIFAFYRFLISPYVLQEKDGSKLHYNYLRESLAVSYLANDWDLPEWFNEKALAKIDKEQYMTTMYPVISQLSGVEQSQYKTLWLEKMRRHPMEYLRQKWIGYQWLWSTRDIQMILRRDLILMRDTDLYGMSLRDFFRDGFYAFYVILAGWSKQLALLFTALITTILLLVRKRQDLLFDTIWCVSCSGVLHSLALLSVNVAANYRYLMWTDIAGTISLFMFFCVVEYFVSIRRTLAQISN